jgi:hypothetical protein
MLKPAAYFIDTCVPIYAAGKAHEYKEPCSRIILAIAQGEIEVVTDTEVIQEIAYRAHAIGQLKEGLRLAEEFLTLMATVLPVTREDMSRALKMQHHYASLPPRDAIHIAVMLRAGLRQIITADRHFDQVREIERIDPAEAI